MDSKHSVWRKLFFKKGCRRNLARAVIRLLRHSYDLINPGLLPGLGHIRDKNIGGVT
ncbi:hypothetical protein QE197_22075 (plasmid) [Arsenophonus nasoniae]|nr:hypothetical protein [Arsenophonus nasoniae]WGM12740.1 hypothetical protein QE197_15640 [Arsenophonus nasoniae]WGM12743.1 hypothetical protein QE197_07135 [Arsenophonus nasoniae]WGM13322.1 hypothetical protein QE197_22075 [Arsenophonus nasoniae]